MKKCMVSLFMVLLLLTGCGSTPAVFPESLTAEVKKHSPSVQPVTEEQAAVLTAFSLELLRQNWQGANILVSPLSALSALGMTANGAGGQTLAQMESALYLPVEDLNNALAAWTAELPNSEACRTTLANSLWFRDDGTFEANQDFLQTVVDWYGADVYPSKFDSAACADINSYVSRHTHGMIEEVIQEIPDASMLYLINALALDAEWAEIYREDQVAENRIFTTVDGQEQPVTLMYSNERYYLEDELAQGFLKPYQGGRWAFAALLPREGVTLEAYIASLSGERLHALLAAPEETLVYTAIPKFQCEYEQELSGSLKAMGMTDAFDPERADFSGLGSTPLGPLFISKVIHKTYIAVDEKGTQAGAVTAVAVEAGGGTGPAPVPVVYLERPFLYMLVDRETNLPAFIGAVTDMS